MLNNLAIISKSLGFLGVKTTIVASLLSKNLKPKYFSIIEFYEIIIVKYIVSQSMSL